MAGLGRASEGPAEEGQGALRRIVCVAANASVDKVAALDRLRPGEINRPDLLSVVPGGKTVNVARAATRLGLEAVVVPVVAGHAGDWLLEALAAEGIPAKPVRVPGETRTCLSVLDRSTGRLTELYEPGPRLDDTGWAARRTAMRESSRALVPRAHAARWTPTRTSSCLPSRPARGSSASTSSRRPGRRVSPRAAMPRRWPRRERSARRAPGSR
jgi:pfkB family carbohydrate kinase